MKTPFVYNITQKASLSPTKEADFSRFDSQSLTMFAYVHIAMLPIPVAYREPQRCGKRDTFKLVSLPRFCRSHPIRSHLRSRGNQTQSLTATHVRSAQYFGISGDYTRILAFAWHACESPSLQPHHTSSLPPFSDADLGVGVLCACFSIQ